MSFAEEDSGSKRTVSVSAMAFVACLASRDALDGAILTLFDIFRHIICQVRGVGEEVEHPSDCHGTIARAHVAFAVMVHRV